MDPASIIGVTAAIQQIIQAVYAYGSSVKSAKSEINQLCSELLALKAALEHIQLNSNIDQLSAGIENLGLAKEAQQILSTSNYNTSEFQQMLSNTEKIVRDLLMRLQRKSGKFHAAKQGLLWHLVKEDMRRDIERLNRLKSFFILATTSDNTVLCRESYLKICAIDVRLQNQEEREEQRQLSKLREALRQWIAPYEPHDLYRVAIQNFQEGTGEWFLNDVLEKWLTDENLPFLWLQARPGSGKTTLLSASIRHVHELSQSLPHAAHLAFFYCSFTNTYSQDPQNIFGSFLAQLCDSNPEFWDEVESHYIKRKGSSAHEPQKLEIEALRQMLTRFANQTKRTILIFLDALNESKQHSQILSNLSFLTRDCSNIRIMLSSTEEIVPNLPLDQHLLVSMDLTQVTKDISKVISTRLSNDSRLCTLPSALKNSIKTTLERDSDGIFRWAECQLSTLADHPSAQDIKSALDNVPLTLEQTYHSILARIPPPQKYIAKQTLFWVAFALKPMTLKELSEAILITDDPSTTNINASTRLLRDEILLKACSSLISYSGTSTCITLAHSSVLTYLTSRDLLLSPEVSHYHLDARTAYNTITRRCINYMLLPAFSHGACPTWDALDARLTQWPLLRYVAETLFTHLYYIDLDAPMTTLLLHFFRTHDEYPRGGGNFGAWVQACFPNATHNIEDSTPLYYAARYGLLPIVRLILATEDGRRGIERKGGVYMSTPLHVAAWQGRTEVVRELLKAGASAREINVEGKPGLVWAVLFGYAEIEGMLREGGARLDERLLREVARERGEVWDEVESDTEL